MTCARVLFLDLAYCLKYGTSTTLSWPLLSHDTRLGWVEVSPPFPDPKQLGGEQSTNSEFDLVFEYPRMPADALALSPAVSPSVARDFQQTKPYPPPVLPAFPPSAAAHHPYGAHVQPDGRVRTGGRDGAGVQPHCTHGGDAAGDQRRLWIPRCVCVGRVAKTRMSIVAVFPALNSGWKGRTTING